MKKFPSELRKCWKEFFGTTPLPEYEHIYKKVILQAKHYRDEVIKQFSVLENHLLQNEGNQLIMLISIRDTNAKLQELLIQFHMLLEYIPHTVRERIRLEHLIDYVTDWNYDLEDCIKIVAHDLLILSGERTAPYEYYQTNILN